MLVTMKEEEIRKREIFNKYLELIKNELNIFFKPNDFVQIPCPACASKDYTFEFEKSNFSYVLCKECATLFVNPRPPFEALKKFYAGSSSTGFWINDFFKPVIEVRREKIFIPRAEYISRVLNHNKGYLIGDIGAGFGLFLEELRKILPDNQYIAIEPSPEMANICQDKKLSVKCMYLEDMVDMRGDFNLLTAFELAEHLYSPVSFFKKVYSLLKPGGYLFVTTLNSQGFDILVLWEKSKSVIPPHHLNFFNVKSIGSLLERLGFEIIEITTPGKLDWDIVEGMIQHEDIRSDRLWSLLAKEGSKECKSQLQEWISKNNLSSHMSILTKKPLKKLN